MRAYLGVAAGFFLAACANGASSDAAASASAADTEPPNPLVLVPAGFPPNSVGDCWTVSADKIQHEAMFYWRGTPSLLGGFLPHPPPLAVFTIDRTVDTGSSVRYEGTQAVPGRAPRHVVVQLDRVPDDPTLAWWHQIGVKGNVTVSDPRAADEVVAIESGHPCDWSNACNVQQ